MDIIQCKKEMSYWTTNRHGGNLNAKLRRLRTVRSQRNQDILEKAKPVPGGQWYQELWERERRVGRAQRISRTVTLLCVVLWWWIHGCICLACRTYNTRSDLIISHGLWAMRMCQCRFSNCNKYATLVGNVYCGGNCVWTRVYGDSLYLLLNFTINKLS